MNSGLRLFKKSAFAKIDLPVLCRGFSFSTTLTLSFLANGLFVKFVPIQYLPREGHSKVNYVRDTLRTLQALTEIITYYNPLKIVLIIDLIPIMLWLLFLVLGVYFANKIFLIFSVIFFSTAILVFVLGLILDLIRLNKR